MSYPGAFIEMLPADLGLSGIDIQTAGTKAGTIVDLRGFSMLSLSLTVVVTGTQTTAASVDIAIDDFLQDQTTLFIRSKPIISPAVVPTAAGTYHGTVTLGSQQAGQVKNDGAPNAFTTFTRAGALEIVGPVGFCRFSVIMNTTGVGATSVLLSLALQASK